MVWTIKILSLGAISFSLFQGLLSVNFLSLWVFLELSTVSFLFYLFCSSKTMMIKDSMKLFLIQALSGLLILVMVLQMELLNHNLLSFLIALVIMLKMSAAPFHGWFLSLINQISWSVVFIFLTVMKFIPLMMLSALSLKSWELFTVLSFIVAAFSSFYLSDLKKLSMISSVFFLGMLYAVLACMNTWLDLMIVYSFSFLALVLFFLKSNEELSSGKLHSSGSVTTIVIFILLVNMAGLPPFPGFFLKLMWLIQAHISLISFLVFIASSGLMMFMYLSFGLKTLGEMNSIVLNDFQINFASMLFMMSVMILTICPLIWVF